MTPLATLENFKKFYSGFQKLGRNPQQAVQELLDTGEMTQQEYNELSKQANEILGAMSLFGGVNKL